MTDHSAGISYSALKGEISDIYNEVHGCRPHSIPLVAEEDLRSFYNSLVEKLEEA